MKVYIASQYKKKADINQKIYHELLKENIDAFLPVNINIDAVPERAKEQRFVADKCYKEIEQCNVILGVWAFGRSVSGELGYAIKSKTPNQKIIIFDTKDEDIAILKNEVMLWPFIDKTVENINDLITYLKTLE